LNNDVIEALKSAKSGETLYVTLGNEMRGDDGLGSYLANVLNGMGIKNIFDAKLRPEDAYGWALEKMPAKVVFIDVADFGGIDGDVRIIPPANISQHTLSTHKIPLSVVAEMIREDTCAEVHIVGIQASSCLLSGQLSVSIKQSADEIASIILTFTL